MRNPFRRDGGEGLPARSEDTPLRLLLGSDAVKVVRSALRARLDELDKWEAVSVKTDF